MTRPRLVIFDRDGTLIENVPYNADPRRVVCRPRALAGVEKLRSLGMRFAVATNQSGVSRGLVSMESLELLNAEIDRLFGGLGTWWVCPHGPADNCRCRKPKPGMLYEAISEAGVGRAEVVFVGDRLSDLEAAEAAGVRFVLVRSPSSEPAVLRRAPIRVEDLAGLAEQLEHELRSTDPQEGRVGSH